MNRKGNQKGFTLLELLVAVAIFAIITVPLFGAFFSSVNLNAKSRNLQRATTAAGNVMEDIKSTQVDTLLQNATYDATSKSYQMTKIERIDGKDFTVEAQISKEQKTSGNATLDQDETTDYNQAKLANVYSMNQVYDAVYMQGEGQNATYAKSLTKREETDAKLFDNIRREVTLRVVTEGNYTRVYIDNKYIFRSGGTRKEEEVGTQEIFSGKGKNPRNIYLMYYAMYNSTLRNPSEIFIIENKENIPVNIYLVCQNYDKTKDAQYLAQIRVLEGARSDTKENCITNMNSNLPLGALGKKGAWYTYLQEVNGTNYNDTDWNNATKFEGTGADTLLQVSTLGNEKQASWVYQVTVNAYMGQGAQKGNESLARFTTTIEKE